MTDKEITVYNALPEAIRKRIDRLGEVKDVAVRAKAANQLKLILGALDIEAMHQIKQLKDIRSSIALGMRELEQYAVKVDHVSAFYRSQDLSGLLDNPDVKAIPYSKD